MVHHYYSVKVVQHTANHFKMTPSGVNHILARMHVVKPAPNPPPDSYTCRRCGQVKPRSDYWQRSDGTLHIRVCKSCNSRSLLSQEDLIAKRAHDRLHRKAPAVNRRYRCYSRKRGLLIDQLKAQPCEDCKQTFPPVCMDFDHVRGEKTCSVSALRTMKWERVLNEIAKCDLVCSNCHRIRTKKRIVLKD